MIPILVKSLKCGHRWKSAIFCTAKNVALSISFVKADSNSTLRIGNWRHSPTHKSTK